MVTPRRPHDPRAVSRSKAAPYDALRSAGRARRRCDLATLSRLRGCAGGPSRS